METFLFFLVIVVIIIIILKSYKLNPKNELDKYIRNGEHKDIVNLRKMIKNIGENYYRETGCRFCQVVSINFTQDPNLVIIKHFDGRKIVYRIVEKISSNPPTFKVVEYTDSISDRYNFDPVLIEMTIESIETNSIISVTIFQISYVSFCYDFKYLKL